MFGLNFRFMHPCYRGNGDRNTCYFTKSLLCLSQLMLMHCAWADAFANYPNRPIRLIVPQAPGTATDNNARILAGELSKQIGQQIVVDNRPGGAFTIGMELLAKATPDGYTISYAGPGPLAINRHLLPTLPYDLDRDIQAVVQVNATPLVLVVAQSIPIRTVQDLITYANKNPGKLLNASAGNGSIGHLAGELFKMMSKTLITHVPYKGGMQIVTDLISGQVQLLFDPLTGISPHIKAGKLRGLAVTSTKRSSSFPDLPTISEAAVIGYDVTTWGGIVTQSGVPPAVVRNLNTAINKTFSSPTYRERTVALGTELPGGTPEQFAQLIRRDSLLWSGVIKKIGMKLD